MPLDIPRADELLRSRAANPYRIATLCGLVMAVLAFAVVFLDADSDARDLSEAIAVLFMIALAMSPLVLGLAGIAAGGLWRKDKWPHLCGGLLSAVVLVYDMCLFMTTGIAVILCMVTGDWEIALASLIALGISLAIVAMLHRAWCCVPRFRTPCQLAFLASSLLAAAWVFLAIAFLVSVLLASLLWLTGAVLLLVGTTGEARALTCRSWSDVLCLLVAGRLSDAHSERGICPGCGYNLHGLAEQRCPECGRAFTFEEIGATPEEMGFGGAKDDSEQEEAV